MLEKLILFIKNTITHLIYSVLYSYTGYQLYDLTKKFTGYKKEKQNIFKAIGYYPNLKNPQSFNEKVLWKKIYDRNPLLPIIADKYRVREHLKEVLGEKEAEKILIPLLYVTDKPHTIPFDDLLEEYIIKANHACRWYVLAENTGQQKEYTIVKGRKTLKLYDSNKTRSEIIAVCKNWLLMPYGFHRHEWAYQKIKRKIVIEKLIRDINGKIPDDYKFSIFHGKCELIQVYYDRFIGINRAWYTPEWEYIDVKGHIKQADSKNSPENLKSMIELSELLGKPFDFIRVDLYSVSNKIYFGELTNYPMGGKTPFNPVSFDYELGSKWKVAPNYWKR